MTYPGALPGRIYVERWRSEGLLHALVALVSLGMWLLLIISVFGLIYVAFIGLFFFVAHMVFIGYVRGSGVKLGPDQFPEVHEAVERISQQLEMEPPDAYIMQSGGALNALATRFLRGNMIILFSDLLEACGENTAARDMIIAHELAHLKCGHLHMRWFLLPGLMMPFLGTALSRAREYTCDRYGYACAGESDHALRGLAILAAGPVYGAEVNLMEFVRQREDVNTGLMTIAEWLATHPPLSKRIAALDPDLGDSMYSGASGSFRASAIVLALLVLIFGGSAGLVVAFGSMSDYVEDASTSNDFETPFETTAESPAFVDEDWGRQVQSDLLNLADFIHDQWWLASRRLPQSMQEIGLEWELVRPDDVMPADPFDGLPYGYALEADGFRLWSIGPDAQSGTADDRAFHWRPRE
jgi:Zn-dependent protease with chaperone function